MGIIIALISGAIMSIQGVFNTEVTKQTSIWVAASFVQVTALIVCVAAYFVTGKDGSFGEILKVSPRYLLLGGVMGAFITYTVIQSISMMGPARAVMLILVSQIAVAYLIELFGLFGTQKADFDWMKLIGLGLIVAGIVIFKWKK